MVHPLQRADIMAVEHLECRALAVVGTDGAVVVG